MKERAINIRKKWNVSNDRYFDNSVRSILSIKEKREIACKSYIYVYIYRIDIYIDPNSSASNFAETRMTMRRGEVVLGKITKITGCKTRRSRRYVLGRGLCIIYTRGKAAWKWECVSLILEHAGNRLFSTLRLVISRAVRGFYPKRMDQRQVYYRKMDGDILSCSWYGEIKRTEEVINNISMLGQNYIWKQIFIVYIYIKKRRREKGKRENREVKKKRYANIIFNEIIYIPSQSIRFLGSTLKNENVSPCEKMVRNNHH